MVYSLEVRFLTSYYFTRWANVGHRFLRPYMRVDCVQPLCSLWLCYVHNFEFSPHNLLTTTNPSLPVAVFPPTGTLVSFQCDVLLCPKCCLGTVRQRGVDLSAAL